jgi:hypothetical protein
MYSISRQNHNKYGQVVTITREEDGSYKNPFQVFNQAKTMRRVWMEESGTKVRILIDGQVMTVVQAEKWSNEEYRNLPKCQTCWQVLVGQVYTHRLCGSSLFCSTHCADKNYSFQVNKLNEEEEIEYL